jgi:hypothetical protein
MRRVPWFVLAGIAAHLIVGVFLHGFREEFGMIP